MSFIFYLLLLPGILFKSAGLFVVPSTKTNILKNPYIATMETMPQEIILFTADEWILSNFMYNEFGYCINGCGLSWVTFRDIGAN